MAMSIEALESTLKKLELNAPDVYVSCSECVRDKKGILREKRYILNLKTGDVFPRRKLAEGEKVNSRIVRSYKNHKFNTQDIVYYAFQNAQIVDGDIVLTTWIFGDGVNYPNTNNIKMPYYGNSVLLDKEVRGKAKDPDALFNIALSEPKIAAAVVVDSDKQTVAWSNTEKYGFNTSDPRAEADAFLAPKLHKALFHAYETNHVYGLTRCFKECFEIGYAGANKYLTFDSYKDVSAFMKSTPMQIKNSEMQKRVDELSTIKLPDHTSASMNDKTICYADRVDDEWTALRWWVASQTGKYVETSRMYVNKTEAMHCRSDLHGRWIYAAAKLKATTFSADRVVLQSPDVLDGTKLDYFKNISAEMDNQSAALYMLTMYPEFEKMYKIGLSWVCNNYLQSPYQTSWKNYLEGNIGHIDWTAKNIFKMVGVNRYQIEAIGEFVKKMNEDASWGTWPACYIDRIIQKMKRIFNVDALNSIDNETFDYILNSLNIDRLVSVYVYALSDTFEMYPKDAMYFIKDLNAIAENGYEFIEFTTQYGHTSEMNIDRLYYDTIQMIQSGGYMDVIRPRFSSVEELLNHHQVMIDLINANEMEREARINRQYESAFQTNYQRWQQWEWEGDNMFCVVAPKQPVDVAAEGITLRHCVKSYIPSVSQGRTNIVFIRRKGKETEPFFTAEVDMTNKIRQVHGMCNCNVDSVEGLAEFVINWAKTKKLKYIQLQANAVRAAR